MESVIAIVLTQMQPILAAEQIKTLADVLRSAFRLNGASASAPQASQLLELFLTAKEVEGCSPKTIEYYRSTLTMMNDAIMKPYTLIESDDLRKYLNDYEAQRGASKVTIDNIRRIMSSFFAWLEDEDYIVKSPVRRIKRIKTAVIAKETFSDEQLETVRESCTTARDRAIVDMLASTGMRIGELTRLNRSDIDFRERECVVTGKGNKQRPVYFDARAKTSLQNYLSTRNDNNPALFVTLNGPSRRASVGSVEGRMKRIEKSIDVGRVHPHKFRRTLATHAIGKGMPIEQVQRLLGHAKIETTMHYTMVDQNNVKASHRKYLE